MARLSLKTEEPVDTSPLYFITTGKSDLFLARVNVTKRLCVQSCSKACRMEVIQLLYVWNLTQCTPFTLARCMYRTNGLRFVDVRICTRTATCSVSPRRTFLNCRVETVVCSETCLPPIHASSASLNTPTGNATTSQRRVFARHTPSNPKDKHHNVQVRGHPTLEHLHHTRIHELQYSTETPCIRRRFFSGPQ